MATNLQPNRKPGSIQLRPMGDMSIEERQEHRSFTECLVRAVSEGEQPKEIDTLRELARSRLRLVSGGPKP